MKFTAKVRFQFGLLFLFLAVPLLGQNPSGTAPKAQPVSTDAQGSQPQAESQGDTARNLRSYIIGRDAVLAISVWKEPDRTRSAQVRSDGKISLPLVGEMDAAGLTPIQLELELTKKLRAYMNDPEVAVIVEQMNSKKFNILGEVAKPGAYQLTGTSTVMDAIAMAGGFKDFAKRKEMYVLRQNGDGSQSRIPFNYKEFVKGKNPAQNIKLEPHDTIIVP